MLFNSFIFFFGFLPITFVSYFWASYYRHELAIVILALASIFFYSYWDVRVVPLLIAAILINYLLGNILIDTRFKESSPRKDRVDRRPGAEFGMHCVFQVYELVPRHRRCHFGSGVLATRNSPADRDLVLHVYADRLPRRHLQQEAQGAKPFTNYVLFVTFFPHLIAGPVLHHTEMMPQFASASEHSGVSLSNGRITFGVMLFADRGRGRRWSSRIPWRRLAIEVFNAAEGAVTLNLQTAWGGALAYTAADLFRLLGLLGHGAWALADVQHRAAAQLRFTLSLTVDR